MNKKDKSGKNDKNIKKYTILLIEDDPNDIMLIKRAFNKAGIYNPIQILENGEDAVAYLAGKKQFIDRKQFPLPILILLDLKLPRKSGHDVLAWVRKQPILKRIPVVVLSSSQRKVDINLAYDLGVNSYLIKPVSFSGLIDLIDKLNIYWLKLNKKADINSGGRK